MAGGAQSAALGVYQSTQAPTTGDPGAGQTTGSTGGDLYNAAQALDNSAVLKAWGVTAADNNVIQSTTQVDQLDSQIGKLDSQISAMSSQQGLPGFDQQAYQSLVSQRAALNLQRWQDGIAEIDVDAQGSTNSPIALVFNTLNSTDPATIAALKTMGIPDYSVLTDPKQASQWLAQVQQTIQSQATAAATAAQTQTANAANAATVTSETNAAIAYGQQQAQTGITTAASMVSTPMQAFDANMAAQFGGVGSASGALAGGLGASGAGAATANTTAQIADKGQFDYQTALNNAQSQAETYLSGVYTDVLNNQFNYANLSTEQQVQVNQEAADQLVTVINNNIQNASAAEKAQLAGLQDLINQYQNATTSDEQKQALIQKIVGISVGALMTVVGVVGGVLTSYTGVGAVGGAALAAAGIGEITHAASS